MDPYFWCWDSENVAPVIVRSFILYFNFNFLIIAEKTILCHEFVDTANLLGCEPDITAYSYSTVKKRFNPCLDFLWKYNPSYENNWYSVPYV